MVSLFAMLREPCSGQHSSSGAWLAVQLLARWAAPTEHMHGLKHARWALISPSVLASCWNSWLTCDVVNEPVANLLSLHVVSELAHGLVVRPITIYCSWYSAAEAAVRGTA
jgi:hypothetical protein